MRLMILFLAVIAVLFILGFALHTLVWVALVALAVWLVLLMVRPRGRVRRWFSF
ncbi:MAG: hydrophobic protein [Candidatus Dormiibacterota bacterium]